MLLACFGCGLLIGATLGWLATLRWLRTEAPSDLTVAYLMGREDERKEQQGKKPMVELPPYMTPGQQEEMRQMIQEQRES